MCVLDRPFRRVSLRVTPWGDFLDAEKVTKDAHRERVFPLKGLSRWAAVATFYLNEPSPATTEVGLRSPFWNPLRMVQCLTLPTDFFAKINLVQKTTLVSRSFAIPWRESKGNRARFLFGGSRVGIQKGRGKRNPRPFCDSLHTFCSYRKYAHGAASSETLLKAYQKHPSLAVGHGLCVNTNSYHYVIYFTGRGYCKITSCSIRREPMCAAEAKPLIIKRRGEDGTAE